jgi:hypothetical protein
LPPSHSQRFGLENVDRTWPAAGAFGHRMARMLLSFERPAREPVAHRTPRVTHVDALCLLTDLENCTVANDTGITGRSRKALPKITVKILRAHGGCLGTKSR